jgi:hypothetical protein
LPSGQQKLFADLGNGNVEAGMKKYFAISGDQRQDTALLTKYMGMNYGEKLMFKKENPALAAQFDALLQSKLPLTPVTVESARP